MNANRKLLRGISMTYTYKPLQDHNLAFGTSKIINTSLPVGEGVSVNIFLSQSDNNKSEPL